MITAGVYDVMSVRLAERAGFDTVVISGYAVSATRLGRPDGGFLSLNDMADVVRNMSARSDVSIIVDCDTGYGNAINAMRTAEEMIAAGAASIFVEDQVAPKRCGHVAGKLVVPAEEFAGKLRAIDKVRRELAPDLVLIARCDARGIAGGTIDDVIRRGQMYAEAGADVVFPEALTSLDELERCGREIGVPLVHNLGPVATLASEEELARMNVCIAFVAGATFGPAVSAMSENLERLKQGGLAFFKEQVTSGQRRLNIHELVGFPEMMALEDEFLPTEQQLARYEGSVGYIPAGLRGGS
jgi:2-methylisocitrate lyase-like PEP mutase family enzyme